MRKILFIFGTRPEAIKLCPLVAHMRRKRPDWTVRTCVTAQHRGLLDQVLGVFGLEPDYDLDCMSPGQTLAGVTARMLAGLEPVLSAERPDMVIVQGDTTTTLCGSLAAFYHHAPVAHVEAGLRTGDLGRPFPEELNRVLVSRIAALHFAPTEWAAGNLRREGVAPRSITVTGNTGIDAVMEVRNRLEAGLLEPPQTARWDPRRKLILVTAHRRESFGEGFAQICAALGEIARRDDVEIAYPVHPNPNVAGPAARHLGGLPNVKLLAPLDYVPFVDLLRRSYLVLTDSGGVQEEAPSLGKPVLVMRETTERPEAVEAGTARLVGNRKDAIVEECLRLLEDRRAYQSMARAHNPYGDGRASERITTALELRWSRAETDDACGVSEELRPEPALR